jgi:opacity protein-like surface antigen
MQKTLLVVFLISLSSSLKSQEAYIIKDGTVVAGINVLDGGEIKNGIMIQTGNSKNPVTYLPEEVEEYGFKDGRKYFSRTVKTGDNEKRLFLERLSEGKLTLYYLRDAQGQTIFAEKENGNLELMLSVKDKNSNDFRSKFMEYMPGCSNVSEALAIFKFNKRSVIKLTEQYNNCEKKPFPSATFGVSAGMILGKPGTGSSAYMQVRDKATLYTIDSDGFLNLKSFSGAVSADFPILLSSFSIFTALDFSFNKYVYHSRDAVTNPFVPNSITITINDANLSVASVTVPVLARYKFYTGKLIPYMNGGPVFSYNLITQTVMINQTIVNNVLTTKKLGNPEFNCGAQTGFSAGAGLQLKLHLKKSISLDVRYNYLIGIEKKSMGFKSLQISTGYNF